MLGDPREDLFFVVHLVSECLRGSSVLTKVETSLTKKKKSENHGGGPSTL